MSSEMNTGGRPTYLLVDGENIDATLGMNVLGHRPNPDERPRWDRINEFARELWGKPVTSLFFLNASSGQMPMPFVQALLAMDYRPIPLAGASHEKVVDIGIQRTLEAIRERDGDVLLASHDGDFIPQIEALLDGTRKVGLLCFREFVNGQMAHLEEKGLTFYDLEDTVGAFNTLLPRVRIIPIEDFTPERFI
ncbi:NYN domain-containing protein [Jonesia quinghaiensis]|uniref:NYN domain-containing protein n=1 Tax=Jonesia quinghaiensis TaxID=262806 RepID=UPI0003F9269D|nr:NYN domain-containing protein [Jonesia quinghaiensis]